MLRLASFSILLLSTFFAAWVVEARPEWTGAEVRRVVCTGATPLTEADLAQWLQQNMPSHMVEVEPQKLVRQLLSDFPYAAVSIQRNWPDEVVVDVEERKPYLMAMGPHGQTVLLDRSGHVVTHRRDQSITLWDRPVVRGCALGVEAPLDTECLQQAVSFVVWLDMVATDWLDELSEVVVDGSAGIGVIMRDGVRIHFGRSPYASKLKKLKYAWAAAERHGIETRAILVTDHEHVILKREFSETAESRGRKTLEGRSSHEA